MKPVSKNFFSLKRALFLFLVIVAIIIGSISFSITLSFLVNNDWHLLGRFGFPFILKTLPYFWFICLVAFIALGEFYYKKTFRGYRHKSIVIVGSYLLITVVLGSVIYSIRVEKRIEQSLHKIPIYRSVMFDREKIWSNPEGGMLSGRIISIEDKQIKIISPDRINWNVNTKNTFIGGRINLIVGQRINIIGEKTEDNNFTAKEIRPWFNSLGKFKQRSHLRMMR